MIFIFALVHIYACFCLLVFRVVNSSSVLFLGGSHVYYGAIVPDGFINLISGVAEGNKSNVTNIRYLASPSKRLDSVAEEIDGYFDGLNGPPSIVIIMLGYDDVISSANFDIEAAQSSTLNIIASIFDAGVESIALCTPLLYGEKIDGSNPFEDELEELSGLFKRLARLNNIDFIDLRMHFLKLIERHNPHNLQHAVFTYDGHHLNEIGQQATAIKILSYLKMETSSIVLPEPSQHRLDLSHKVDTVEELVDDSELSNSQIDFVDSKDTSIEWSEDIYKIDSDSRGEL